MHCFYRKTSLWRKFPISSSALYLYIFSKLASQFMFSISRCEAADVSSPVEMAVEVVNGNIFYNSPLEETIRIHLHYIRTLQHYHLNINNWSASVWRSRGRPSSQMTRRGLLLYQVDIFRRHQTDLATCFGTEITEQQQRTSPSCLIISRIVHNYRTILNLSL